MRCAWSGSAEHLRLRMRRSIFFPRSQPRLMPLWRAVRGQAFRSACSANASGQFSLDARRCAHCADVNGAAVARINRTADTLGDVFTGPRRCARVCSVKGLRIWFCGIWPQYNLGQGQLRSRMSHPAHHAACAGSVPKWCCLLLGFEFAALELQCPAILFHYPDDIFWRS